MTDHIANTHEPIGRVETAEGSVTVIHVDGTREVLNNGDAIYEGDHLETGADGRVGLTLADGATFSLSENGAMTMDSLVYSPAEGAGEMAVSVARGVFVFVSGQIAKSAPDAMTVSTPIASIGVRGTKVAGRAGGEGEESVIALLPEAGGHVGEITITTDGGLQVINQANLAVTLIGRAFAPSDPIQLEAAQIDQLFGRTLESLPESRSDEPVQQDTDAAAIDGGDPIEAAARGDADAQPQHPEQHQAQEPLQEDVLILHDDFLRTPYADENLITTLREEMDRLLVRTGYQTEIRSDTIVSRTIADEINVITGTSGADSLSGTAGRDDIWGYDGNDTLSGLDSGDRLHGGLGNDVLNGGNGNDELWGDSGADTLIGGRGIDNMTGGAGADTFGFIDPTDGVYVATNGRLAGDVARDLINDFVSGTDQFQLQNSNFNIAYLSTNDTFILLGTQYDGTNAFGTSYAAGNAVLIRDVDGILYYDDNGNADGYTVLADLQGAAATTSDVSLI